MHDMGLLSIRQRKGRYLANLNICEPEYTSALARVDGLGTVPVAVGSSATGRKISASAPVYVVVGGVVGNQIGEAQWSAYARTSPTSTSADATIATDTVGDEPSGVPPSAGVVADELVRGQVEASMPPVVDARIPPASGPVQLPLTALMVTLVARLQLPYLLMMPSIVVGSVKRLLLLPMVMENQLVVWLVTFPCHLLTPDFHPPSP